MKYKLVFTTNNTEAKRQMLSRKVRAMADLPVGFSFGEGVPVEESAIATAEELISLASDLELDADVFPNMDGGCAVAFYRNEDKVEASISPDGTAFDLRVERGVGFEFEDITPPQENVSFERVIYEVLLLQLREPSNLIWKLSESSTSASLTERANDFAPPQHAATRQGPLKTLLMAEGGSQSSTPLALV